MTPEQIFAVLGGVVRRQVGIDIRDGQFHTRRLSWRDLRLGADLELDALGQIDLVLEIEREFRVRFTPAEAHGFRTLGAIAELLAVGLAAPAAPAIAG